MGEQTNPKLLSVNHCMKDEFQSIPPPPQDRNVFRSVFSLTAVSDSALRESTNYFGAFYTKLWRTKEGGQLLKRSCLLNITANTDNGLDFS